MNDKLFLPSISHNFNNAFRFALALGRRGNRAPMAWVSDTRPSPFEELSFKKFRLWQSLPFFCLKQE